MLFLNSHRDIVLDPSLVNVALMDHGQATEIGIGSNLLSSPWVRQLVKLNSCFVVERSGSARTLQPRLDIGLHPYAPSSWGLQFGLLRRSTKTVATPLRLR